MNGEAFNPSEVDGVPITRVEAGGLVARKAGAGPAIVFFHGGRGSWNHWIRNIGPLSRRFTVYAPDLPGFGESMELDMSMTFADYLPITVKAIQALCRDEESISLAGFSFGGMTAANVAAELGGRVDKLSLQAPAGWGGEDRVPEGLRGLRRDMSDAEISEVHRFNLGVMLLAHPENITDESTAFQRYNIEAASFNSARESGFGHLFPALKRVSCPVQFIIGTADVVQFPTVEDRVARLRETHPEFRVDLIDGAGHWAQYDDAEAYNRLLTDFLSS